MDAAALLHDQDYDKVGAAGFKGAVKDVKTVMADIALVQRANTVIELYKKGAIDPYTNEKVSKHTYKYAKRIKKLFSWLARRKVRKALRGTSTTKKYLDENLKKKRSIRDDIP